MTIPSIGGNGESSKIIIKSNPVIPAVNDATASLHLESENLNQQIPETNEDISFSDNNKNNPVVPDKNVSTKAEDKEYSIDQFRKDYDALLVNKVIPVLTTFEDERKRRLVLAIVLVVIFVLLSLIALVAIQSKESGRIAGLFLSFAFLAYHVVKKSFEKKIKKKVMPTLMKAVPGFYWQETPPVTQKDIKDCLIIPFTNFFRGFDDCFVGKYRGVDVAISECDYSSSSNNSNTVVLEGVVIRIKMNKSFEGVTVVRPRKPGYRDKYDDLKKHNMEEVKLEDSEFEKRYIVYSTDQIESRYLLTTSFIERFKNIEMAFESKFAYCSFYGDSVYIAPHSGKDLFAIGSLVRPVADTEQFVTLFNEFASILALVDYFKLDKKLGL